MTVQELIELLQQYPKDTPVAYMKYSEYCLLEKKDIEVGDHCEAREDGWVQYKRPDKPSRTYILFPGN